MSRPFCSFACLALAAPLAAQSPLIDGLPIPGSLASGGFSILKTDVDGDGRVDLTLWDAYRGRVGVSYGQEDGTFSPATRAITLSTRIKAVVSGDLDVDGHADFVIVTDSLEILTYFGTGEGWDAGPVSPWVGIMTSEDVLDLELVDVDGDGSLDLSTRRPFEVPFFFEREPMVALGSPGGLFGALTNPVQGNWEGTAFRFVDLDGDSDLDMVTVSPLSGSAPSQAAVIFNNGSFPLDPAGAVFLGSGAMGSDFVSDVLVADEEGDGDLDIYLLSSPVGSFGSEVSISSQVSTATFGALRTVVSSSFGFGALNGVDFEGDGDMDLVFSGRGDVTLDAGFFTSARGAQSYSAPVLVDLGFDRGVSLVAGDLDGDGLGEVVQSVRRRDDPATAENEEQLLISRVELNGLGVWAATQDSPLSVEVPGTVLAVAPLRDGELSSIFLVDRDAQKIFLKRNEGGNRFGRQEEVASLAAESSETLLLGDLNGDGAVDLTYREVVGPDLVFFTLLGDGTGAFAAPVALTSVPATIFFFLLSQPLLADLDGDGDLDLVFDRSFAPMHLASLNDGFGQFGVPYSLYAGSPQQGWLQLADLDEDGIQDLAMVPMDGFRFAKGIGDGTFAAPTLVTLAPGTLRVQCIGDFDGDDVEDLLLSQGLSGSALLRLARGLGDGTFASGQAIGTPTAFPSIRVFANDVDLDGDLDVLLREGSSRSIRLLENAGTGVFLAPQDTQMAESTSSPGLAGPVWCDTDNDGDTDVLVLALSGDDRSIWLVENGVVGAVGSEYCGTAVPNSTGVPSAMSAVGSEVAAINQMRLDAVNLPQASTGFFLTGRTQGLVSSVPGSVGTLCLGGRIGRFIGPGQVQNSGAAGTFSLDVDLTTMPDPLLGLVPALPGETWSFQAWHRDVTATGAGTSNFSSAVAVQLR